MSAKGVAEAEIVEWSVKVGDLVREDQVVAAVMTDKATVEIPTPGRGHGASRSAAAVGDVLAVGSELIRIDAPGLPDSPPPPPPKRRARRRTRRPKPPSRAATPPRPPAGGQRVRRRRAGACSRAAAPRRLAAPQRGAPRPPARSRSLRRRCA